MKHESLAQAIYAREDILCELSPYILTKDEALKMHPVYYDLVEHNLIIYDPAGLIARIIDSTRKILLQSESRKVRQNNTWEWQTLKIGFPGEVDL